MDTPFERGMAASAQAGRALTEHERDEIRAAIQKCYRERPKFTTDRMWAILGPHFANVGRKAVGSMLSAVARAGHIKNSGVKVISVRDDAHGHGQTLSVWISLVYRNGKGAP